MKRDFVRDIYENPEAYSKKEVTIGGTARHSDLSILTTEAALSLFRSFLKEKKYQITTRSLTRT